MHLGEETGGAGAETDPVGAADTLLDGVDLSVTPPDTMVRSAEGAGDGLLWPPFALGVRLPP